MIVPAQTPHLQKPKRKIKKPPVVPPVIPPSKPIKDMTKQEVDAELRRISEENQKANKKYEVDREKLDDKRLKLRSDWQKKRKNLTGKAYDTAYAKYLVDKKAIGELIDDLDASDQKRFEEVMRRQKPYTDQAWALDKAKFGMPIPLMREAGGATLTTELWFIERAEEAVRINNPNIEIGDHSSPPEVDA